MRLALIIILVGMLLINGTIFFASGLASGTFFLGLECIVGGCFLLAIL